MCVSKFLGNEGHIGKCICPAPIRLRRRNDFPIECESHANLRKTWFRFIIHRISIVINEDPSGEEIYSIRENVFLILIRFYLRTRDLLQNLREDCFRDEDIRREDNSENHRMEPTLDPKQINRKPEAIQDADVPLVRALPPADLYYGKKRKGMARCILETTLHAMDMCVQ